MDHILSIHEQALYHFEKGAFENSRNLFELCFSTLKNALETQVLNDDSQASRSSTYFPQYSPRSSLVLPLVKDQGLMFSSPLKLDLSNEFSVDQLAFTTFYNLALSTHICSIRDHTLRSKSVHMWEMVHSLHSRNGLRLQTHHTFLFRTLFTAKDFSIFS